MNVAKAGTEPAPFVSSAPPSSPPPPAHDPKPAPKAARDQWEERAAPESTETRLFVDEGTRQSVVEVRDAETKDLIREMPSEEVRQMVENLLEIIGNTVDERA